MESAGSRCWEPELRRLRLGRRIGRKSSGRVFHLEIT
jgi:hypothetical protein